MNNLACALTGIEGETIALTNVSVSAVLNDLLSEVTVSQTYRNDENVNIEAVYTFPLPLDAVLLDLEVEIGGHVLKGMVIEKSVAEENYEEAVGAGDAAVMLEVIEPGLYTMNVGNLRPKEQATITFSYAVLYRWMGDRLRVLLPTTIAPRYGDSAHAPHQVPESSLTVENSFSLRVEIFGSLREAQFVCPSHKVNLTKSVDKVVIALQQTKAIMDRDFILNVKALKVTRSFALCDSDGDGVAVVASFQPFFPGLQQPRPLKLAIVIDCSGSMQGDSMEQAKQALEGILDALQPRDHLTLIAFGTATKVLSDRLLPCNKNNLEKARRFAKEMDADMGGTEIGSALDTAYEVMGSTEFADIFLVTDGEVSSWKEVVSTAKRAGHRIFTVGVGSAVSEAFVRGLAAGTGGECELVSPSEGMADRVIRHFERMRAPRAKRVVVHWPESSHAVAPSTLGAVFEGDTVIAFARFDRPAMSGSVVLEVETEQCEVTRQELPISAASPSSSADSLSTVARLAASARMKELDAVAGLELALRYRLVSPWTNWLVVAPRSEEEKAQGLPELRKVPHTLAAGWGGVGTTLYSMAPAYTAESEIPELAASRPAPRPDLPEPFGQLIALIKEEPSKLDAKRAFDLLQEAGFESEFDDLFRHADSLGLNVNAIAAILLARLLHGPLGKYLPAKLRDAVESLGVYAETATISIIDVERCAITLIEVTESANRREVFENRQARAIGEAIERFTKLRDLLDHLKDCVQMSVEQIENY